MEAVPKLALLSFSVKQSPESPSFGSRLKQYITEAFREDGEAYSNEMHQLESLRAAAVRPTIDSAGLTALKKYFCQLRAMQTRFPMAKGQPAAIVFTWKDLYANMSCPLADIRFEMACILYNIGAVHSQLGAAEPRTNPDSLKTACVHFQNAAWAFQHLREHYPQPPGVDVSTDIMRLFQEICLAQAQECVLSKSIQDTKKPNIVGAVATQVLAFYKNSLAILGPSGGQDNIYEIIGTKLYNVWYRYLSFKSSYIGCIVCLYQGMHADEQQKMGERVAYYQLSLDKLIEANKLSKYIEPKQVTQEALTFTNDVVEGKRKAAKNENEFIYHEEVPEKDLLVDLKPVCLVKATPINFDDPEVAATDIFSKLVPMGAHEAASMYSEEKAKVLRQILQRTEEKNNELLTFLSSLQLDQLSLVFGDQKIPQEIVDKCAAMNANSDIIQNLTDSMNSLAEVISDVEHSLADCKSLIQEEVSKEKEYQKTMGPRPPSIVQTELSREFNKYQEAHARTTESNQVLHKAMTLHIANLKLLALPLDVLESKIPSVDNIEGLDRNKMAEMQTVVQKAREMEKQREMLIQNLREQMNNDDVTSALLARSNQTPQEVFDKEIEKHNDLIKIIDQNLAAQENILNRLTSVYAAYGESRRLLADVARKREALINALITSYDNYEELLGKCQKGLEFYKKLSHNIHQLYARVRSTSQVNEEERATLLSKHNARSSANSTPSAKSVDMSTPSTEPARPKLKDYLPYMKNRNLARTVTPHVQPELPPADNYYPESIYPTSIRPAPVGSEATTDPTQMKYPDGYAMPSQSPNPYNPYMAQYAAENNPYAPAAYPYNVPKAYEPNKVENDPNYGYTSPYTPPQYAQNQQIYSPQTHNPYYSATQDNATVVTDSQTLQYGNVPQGNVNPIAGQNIAYSDGYAIPPTAQTPIPASLSNYGATSDLNSSFAQMQVTPKPEPKYDGNTAQYGGEYAQTYYSMQAPQAASSNMATYSHAINTNDSNTSLVQSQVPTDYSSLNYPYSTPQNQTYPNQSTVPTSSYPQNPVQETQGAIPTSVQGATNQPYMQTPEQTPQHQTYFQNQSAVSFDPNFSYAATSNYTDASQAYAIYTQADSTSVQSVTTSLPQTYAVPEKVDPTLSQLDSMDKPIKSHVSGQAFTNTGFQPSYQTYDQNYAATYQNQAQPNMYQYNEQTSASQNYQNHPGYNFNPSTGVYEYSYGGQASFSQSNVDPNAMAQNRNSNTPGVYTSAGMCETVQSPSETPANTQMQEPNNQMYYNNPYGYQTMQPNEMVPNAQGSTTNYGADVNQPTYMHSGNEKNSVVTYSSNNVSSPVENQTPSIPPENCQNSVNYQNVQQIPVHTNTADVNNQSSYQYQTDGYQSNTGYQVSSNVNNEQNVNQQNTYDANNYQNMTNPSHTNYQNNTSTYQNIDPNTQTSNNDQSNYQVPNNNYQAQANTSNIQESTNQNTNTNYQTQNVPETTSIPKQEVAKPVAVSNFDLLSDIDFSVEHQPLTPQIKVPQISETAIKKQVLPSRIETTKPQVKQEVPIERPAKRDLFSDPTLLNNFTEEVKSLQRMVDSLTDRTPSGLTLLDTKWKMFQDIQLQENMNRSKTIAMQNSSGNILTEVVPFDDTRLTLKYDPDVYINASYYKQLAPWCIPLVISKSPVDQEVSVFWNAVFENKIACVACLLSEIEMQGKFYFPTAKGQTLELERNIKVTLEEVKCTVHWTERRLTVTDGNTVVSTMHYQINVFPAKIVCTPLVLLSHEILSHTYEGLLSNRLRPAWLHCSIGAGRCSVLALLVMTMCQVRAGQLRLCEFLESGCINLYKHRANVLEDTKYLADAHRTVLFYVQGVLCSGTTMFNGEAVFVQSGASMLPPITPTGTKEPPKDTKLQKLPRESFEEMRQTPGLKSGDMKDPLNFLDPLWSLKKK